MNPEEQQMFDDNNKKSVISPLNKRFVKFFIVSLGGLGLNELLVFVALTILDKLTTNKVLFTFWVFKIEKIIPATFTAILFIMVYNYILNKLWTFREKEEGKHFNTVIQFIKFSIVGASGTVVNLGIVYLLATILGFNEYLATSIGFILSVINNFIFNEIWTFNPKFAHVQIEEIE
ncbi:MAG: GtrA family protein [Candidatus Heimdallarchaeaceae archaeon]